MYYVILTTRMVKSASFPLSQKSLNLSFSLLKSVFLTRPIPSCGCPKASSGLDFISERRDHSRRTGIGSPGTFNSRTEHCDESIGISGESFSTCSSILRMMRSSVALMVLLVGLLMVAQSTTVLGIRGLSDVMPERNSTMLAMKNYTTTTTDLPLEQQQQNMSPAADLGEVAPEKVLVEDSTAEGRFSTERVQMEQSGWSCSGGFSSQAHAWYCAGRSVY